MAYDLSIEETLRSSMLKERRRIYEDELNRLAAQVGCTGTRRARVIAGPILNELNEQSKQEAASIARTYNRDLARAIAAIRAETPTANRNLYARRLQEWDEARQRWKTPQIGMNLRSSAIQKAQDDFMRFNNVRGAEARMVPRIGVCPICQRLINLGWVDAGTVRSNPAPIHVNCPHTWEWRKLDKLNAEECQDLWLGE
jgi:hypothetical protein